MRWCNMIEISVGYDLGGVLTNNRRELEHSKKGVHLKEMHCLHPGDIYPFTRRPLFIIVDSDNSFAFQHIPKYFGQPLVTLMSPQDTPPTFQGFHFNKKIHFRVSLHTRSQLTFFLRKRVLSAADNGLTLHSFSFSSQFHLITSDLLTKYTSGCIYMQSMQCENPSLYHRYVNSECS